MLIALNKPFNVLCQFTDRGHGSEHSRPRRTLVEFARQGNVYPAGRLDYDSEGLLLLTDDGAHDGSCRFTHLAPDLCRAPCAA